MTSTKALAPGWPNSCVRVISRRARSTTARSSTCAPRTFTASHSATSSQASADGPTRCGSPGCPITIRSGQARHPASRSAPQDGRKAATMIDTSPPHFVALVGTARPGVLLGEQVASAEVFGKAAKRPRSNAVPPPDWAWLDDLSDRLEAARYTVGAVDFPSAGVGAPHIRQRTYFGAVAEERVSNFDGSRSFPGAQRGIHCQQEGPESRHGEPERSRATRGMGNANCFGRNGQPGKNSGAEGGLRCRHHAHAVSPSGTARGMVDGFGTGLEGLGGHVNRGGEPGWIVANPARSTSEAGPTGRMVNADGRDASAEREQSCGQYGQQPEDGRINDADRRPGPTHGFWETADWLRCRDERWRPVEPGTFPLADGIPARMGRLRGYGNAINPQAAAQFIRAFFDALDDFARPASEPFPHSCADGLIV